MREPNDLGPNDLRDLTYGEHVVLWAFRAMASGRGACPLVRREFAEACGTIAPEAHDALRVFVRLVAIKGRRPVTLGQPGCLAITADEQVVLALFAAAQDDDELRFEAHLSWLLAGPVYPPFRAAAGILARALAMHGHALRKPSARRPRPVETSHLRVVA